MMNFKGKGLGKGLASLLGESNVDDTKKYSRLLIQKMFQFIF